MSDDEFNQAKAFLNSREVPSPDDILNLFFLGKEDDLNKAQTNVDAEEVDFELLGEADDIRTEKGTEWIVTRLLWDTPDGIICRINLIKLGDVMDGDGIYSVRPIYPYDVTDIDYEEVKPLTYKELLEHAVEDEDFEEAARLRDWDKGLKQLLLDIKPRILEALKEQNVIKLDELLTQIRVYRSTLLP